MAASFQIRSAKPTDAGLILSFIKALAEYEKLSHEVTATEEDLHKNLFEHKYAEVVIGYHKDSEDGEEGMSYVLEKEFIIGSISLFSLIPIRFCCSPCWFRPLFPQFLDICWQTWYLP
jgi:hypothetical protein